MKKIILTADDFGINIDTNSAIKEAFNNGVLTSSCIMTNTVGYQDSLRIIKELKNKNPNLDIGIHLNIIEGYALVQKENNPLADKQGMFNNSFIKILINSYNKNYISFIEEELRAQIEKLLNDGIKPNYINSHVHTHSIPEIFKLCAKLAKEYGINSIRTQKEPFYLVPNCKRHLKLSYLINIIKNLLLKFFTRINKKTIEEYNLKTNENFIGILYTANMDKQTILEGIKKLKDNTTAEIILHPTKDTKKEKNYIEFQTLIDNSLKKELESQDVKLITWSKL